VKNNIKPGALIEIIGEFKTFPEESLSCMCWNETDQRIAALSDGQIGIYLEEKKETEKTPYNGGLGSRILVDETIYLVSLCDFRVLKNDK
jgi:hypothetical protein